ncbi:MAG: D-2-hydroxyacid dehydrogenase [Candidatus Zixiibacteriota bacterium]
MKEKIKIAVAISERKQDFETFRQEVYSSKRLSKKVDLIPSLNKEHLKKIIPDAEILVCFSIDKKTFLSAKKLKWIHGAYVGVDKFLFPELLKSKVLLTSSRGIHGDTVSDHIMAMILAFAKGLVPSWSCKKQRKWCQVEVMKQRFEPQEKLLGIVGFGTIGQTIAQKAKAFGMKVMATKNRVKRGESQKYVDRLLPKDKFREFLCTADFVVLTVPLTKDTYHMIGAKELECMKKTAILINASRGGVIDERALIHALLQKKIAGAGLDVFEEEPLSPKSKLWDLENVIITPHVAGSRRDYFKKVGEIFRINLNRYLNRKPLLNLLDKKLGY